MSLKWEEEKKKLTSLKNLNFSLILLCIKFKLFI